mmetsp:Transcript_14762/g.25006  ORF Transcript_14762/g.25006 Transcript_14762/m.25006 type:complete len:259 (-) Transcript_14762:122-898(-)
MPFEQADLRHRQKDILSRVIIKSVGFGEADLHDTVTDDTNVGNFRVAAGGHDDSPNEQVDAPREAHQNRNEYTSVEECTRGDGCSHDHVDVVKDLKHFAAEPWKSCDHNDGHEEHHQGTCRIHLVGKQESGKIRCSTEERESLCDAIPADHRRMIEGHICVEQTIDIGNTSGKFVVPNRALKGHTQQQRNERVVDRRTKRKDERGSRRLARDSCAGIHKGVGHSSKNGQKEWKENQNLTPCQKDIHFAKRAAQRNTAL